MNSTGGLKLKSPQLDPELRLIVCLGFLPSPQNR